MTPHGPASAMGNTLEAARAQWAQRIAGAWRKSAEAILETGRLLREAKDSPPHGAFLAMIETDLPFGARTTQMLMKIADDPRLANTNHGSLLPPSWRTLYELTKLTDEQFEAKLSTGGIHSEMERRTLVIADQQARRATLEAELGAFQAALPQKRYGVIYADPAWRYEVYSRETGLNKSADNHYPTMTLEEIMALDVRSIAAHDCILFMWATGPPAGASLSRHRGVGICLQKQSRLGQRPAGHGPLVSLPS